jgi:hypothetical protein
MEVSIGRGLLIVTTNSTSLESPPTSGGLNTAMFAAPPNRKSVDGKLDVRMVSLMKVLG